MPVNPALRKLKQEDYYESKAILSCTVNIMLARAIQQDLVSKQKKRKSVFITEKTSMNSPGNTTGCC